MPAWLAVLHAVVHLPGELEVLLQGRGLWGRERGRPKGASPPPRRRGEPGSPGSPCPFLSWFICVTPWPRSPPPVLDPGTCLPAPTGFPASPVLLRQAGGIPDTQRGREEALGPRSPGLRGQKGFLGTAASPWLGSELRPPAPPAPTRERGPVPPGGTCPPRVLSCMPKWVPACSDGRRI